MGIPKSEIGTKLQEIQGFCRISTEIAPERSFQDRAWTARNRLLGHFWKIAAAAAENRSILVHSGEQCSLKGFFGWR